MSSLKGSKNGPKNGPKNGLKNGLKNGPKNGLKQEIKKGPRCSFCKKTGHKITQCADPKIENLNQEAMDMGTFSIMALPNGFYVKWWLGTLTSKGLEVLARYHKISDLSYDSDLLRRNALFGVYYELRTETDETIQFKFDDISDTRLHVISEMLRILWPNCGDYITALMLRLRPPPRKFKIVPILAFGPDEDETKEEKIEKEDDDACPVCYEQQPCSHLIKTNCGHTFCSPCLSKYFVSLNNKPDVEPSCPMCRCKIETLAIIDLETFNTFTEKFCQ